MKVRGRSLYPLGFFSLALIDTVFHQWTMYFHAPAGETHLARYVGIALLVANLAQGVSDPFVGAYADRVRTRFGRRRPFILFFTPLLALVFSALWLSPGLGTLLFLPVYSVLFVLVAQPYLSMLPTLAEPGPARVRISLAANVLALVASGIALIGAPRIFETYGFAPFGAVCAASLLLTVFVPALVLDEPIPAPTERPEGSIASRLRALFAISTVRSFLFGNVLAVIAMTLLTVLAPYVPTAFLGESASALQSLNACLFVGMLVSVPIVGRLARTLVPRRIFGIGAIVAVSITATVAAFGHVLDETAWCVGFFLLGFPALLSIAASPLELSRLADDEAKGNEGLLFGLNGLVAPGIGRAAASQIASALIAYEGLGLAGSVRIALACASATFLLAAIILLRSRIRVTPA